MQADGLDVAESARRFANRAGDCARHGNVRSIEQHVIGDQESARADHGRAGGPVRGNVADIGRRAIELLAANCFQTLAGGPSRRGSVEINGNAEALPDLLSGAMRGCDGIVH